MKRHVLKMPFLVTLGVSAAACGSTVTVESEGGTGGSGGTTSTTTPTTSSGETSVSSVSSGTNPPAPCPDLAPDGFTSCDLPPDQVCTYDVPCQSGVRSLAFVCEEGSFVFADQTCVEPFDHCPGTEYYCDEGWWMPNASNPPSPCPDQPPEPGSPCVVGGMGGDWEHCGYACDGMTSASGWTVYTCEPNDGGGSAWVSDGACIDL